MEVLSKLMTSFQYQSHVCFDIDILLFWWNTLSSIPNTVYFLIFNLQKTEFKISIYKTIPKLYSKHI